MRNALVVLILGLLVLPVGAQEEGATSDAPEAQSQEQSRDDRRIQWQVDRLRRSLDLSDEQVGKITDIYKESNQAREEEIQGVLSEEQKTQYQQERNASPSRTRSSRGGQGSRGGSMMARMGGMGNIQEQLGLSDEQMEKIQPMIDEFTQGLMERFQNRDRSEPFDWRAEMENLREDGEALREKVKEHLTDEQKTKADELWEQGRQMMERFTGGGGRRRKRAGRRPAEPVQPDSRTARRRHPGATGGRK